jgi:hypothetical protein
MRGGGVLAWSPRLVFAFASRSAWVAGTLSPHRCFRIRPRHAAAAITLSAWGHQLGVSDASDTRVAEFFSKYIQGDQTPEKGATCSGGKTA